MTFLTLAACEPASVQLISRNNGRIPPCRGVRLARHRRTHRPIQMHAKLNYSPVYRIEFFVMRLLPFGAVSFILPALIPCAEAQSVVAPHIFAPVPHFSPPAPHFSSPAPYMPPRLAAPNTPPPASHLMVPYSAAPRITNVTPGSATQLRTPPTAPATLSLLSDRACQNSPMNQL